MSRKIVRVEVSDSDVTFYFDDTGKEPFTKEEFHSGSKTRNMMEDVEVSILNFEEEPPLDGKPESFRVEPEVVATMAEEKLNSDLKKLITQYNGQANLAFRQGNAEEHSANCIAANEVMKMLQELPHGYSGGKK